MLSPTRPAIRALMAAGLVMLCTGTARAVSRAAATPAFSTATATIDSRSDLPSFLEFRADSRPAVSSFFVELAAAYALSPENTFVVTRTDRDALGETHHRFQQQYRGVPILGAEYILHERSGVVRAANGALVRDLGLEPAAALSVEGALAAARAHVGAQVYMWEDPFWEENLRTRTGDPTATYFPKGELWWVPNVLGSPEAPSRHTLAYRFDIYSANPHSSVRVFVDASTGAIVRTLPLESNCTGTTVNTIFDGTQNISTDKYTATNFRMRDNCTAAVIRIRDWNSATLAPSPLEIENTTNTWTTMNERFAGTVLWEANQSYLYYLNTFTRASYDNADGDIDGYINAQFDCSPPAGCISPDNASMSFSGGTLKVGLGSSGTLANSWSSLDIIGHEYTHAVTGSSAMLVYANESGALNESFSDIFGEMIENESTGPNDWLMGQDRTNGAIRSMANPNAFNDPDTYKGTNWFTGTADAGGVHTNSGVQNFWFFLLSQGGSGTNDKGWAYSVSGIGRAKASAIAYRNLTVYLGANSTYNDARTGAISAAADLYGANSAEQQAVIKAWRAVGIDPCELTCPSDVVVANDAGQCGATVNFAATTDNGECFTVTTSPASGTFFAVGTTSVTSTATSGASCTFNVTVNDTEDPSITCPANIVQANDTGQCGAIVTFTPTASDNCPGVTTSSSPPSGSFFPVGVTQVTSTATDAAGNDVSCNFTVTVQDTEKPTITVGLSPGILWPPDHKLDTIEADVDIADNCPGATFILLSITCDEAVDGHGDGSTLPDIVGATTGTADTEFELRAERDGSGDGRDYTIVYKVTDASNNTAEATGHVFVQQETPGSLASVSGLTSNGRAVDPKAGSVVFMIPSLTSPDGVTFDAASIVSTGIVLGNSGGVIAVESDQLSDLSNDGMSDRVLSFPAQPLRNLTAPGAIEPVALRYLTQNGESYLVPDVLALGRPMRSGKGGTEVLTSDGSKVGSSVSKTGLMGSSPSPFAASTRLDYGLVRSTAVRIDVYDVSGRLVRPLVSSFETAGSHSVNWDGLDDSGHRLGNGVYFIRFEADGVRDNLRVVRMN